MHRRAVNHAPDHLDTLEHLCYNAIVKCSPSTHQPPSLSALAFAASHSYSHCSQRRLPLADGLPFLSAYAQARQRRSSLRPTAAASGSERQSRRQEASGSSRCSSLNSLGLRANTVVPRCFSTFPAEGDALEPQARPESAHFPPQAFPWRKYSFLIRFMHANSGCQVCTLTTEPRKKREPPPRARPPRRPRRGPGLPVAIAHPAPRRRGVGGVCG